GGFVSKFDTISLQWSEPTTSGSIPREYMKYDHCVILGHNIYVYGGYTVHQMNILDTSKLLWSTFTSSLIYSGTQNYSATLLNDSILYIGGTFGSYDGCQTNSNQETTSGQIPTRKCHHASVYIPQHNRILLFYGADDITINSLDTLTFTWTIPVILNSGGPLRCLEDHTATLVGAYVLIAFGYYQTDEDVLISSDIFLLDVSRKDSYKWVTIYDPINSIQPVPASPTSTSNFNIGSVITGTIGVTIGMIIGGIPTSPCERAGEEMKWVQCVILGHKIHIYGGFTSHKMNILDTLQLYWSSFTSSLMYSGTQFYSATLLNDSILYIGGAFSTLGPYCGDVSMLNGCQTNSYQEV
ncbi:14851_t:CDS:2, partial [Gigaspora rosea]